MIKNKFITAITFTLLSFGGAQAFADSDSDITSAVQAKISADPITANSKIDVTTKDGVVNLLGNVQTEGEATAAIEAANSVVGIKEVDTNHLMVPSNSQPYEDKYITAKVKGSFMREKLFGDKSVSVNSVNVETKNGIVYLTGTVDIQDQATNAVNIAKSIKGVKSVDSKIEIKK